MINYIYFRMKSEKDKTRVTIPGSSVAIRVLKQKIAELKNFKEDVAGKKKGPNPAYVLILFNEQTKEEYKDESLLVQSGTSVIVKRTPVSLRPKIDANSNKQPEELVPVPPPPRLPEIVEKYSHLTRLIVDGRTPDFLLCPLCDGLIEDPGLATCCGFEACELCLQKYQECRKCQQRFELIPNKRLREMLAKVKGEIEKWIAEKSITQEMTAVMENATYFYVKSDNPKRLLTSLHESEWVVGSGEVATILNAEMESKQNVLFLFVSYKGSNFCGLARMMSPVIRRLPSDLDANERSRLFGILNLKWLIRANLSAQKTVYLRSKDGLAFKKNTSSEVVPCDPETAEKLVALMESETKMPIPEFIAFPDSKLAPDPELAAEAKSENPRPRKHHKEHDKTHKRSRSPDRHKAATKKPYK